MKNCEYCNKEHSEKYGSGRFCSHECKQKYCISIGKNNIIKKTKCNICNKQISNGLFKKHRLKHIREEKVKKTVFVCEYCNKKFNGKKNNANRFCSLECAKGFSTKAKRKEINEIVKKKLTKNFKIVKICDVCNKIFITYDDKQECCSKICRTIKQPIKPLFIKICPYCKNTYETYKENQICCSRKCQIKKLNSSPEAKERSRKTAKKYFKGNRNSYAYGWYNSNIAGKVFLESSYELKVAEELDKNNIRWTRPKHFYWINEENEEKRYFPDFYLIDYEVYLDPKNIFLINQDKDKIKRVIQQNNIKLLILDKNNLTWSNIKKLINLEVRTQGE